jgi:hypothetical protein
MLRFAGKARPRRRHHTEPSATPTVFVIEPPAAPQTLSAFNVPRLTWTSVITERAISERPLSLRKDLQIRPLLDDPRLRRAMGLDRPVADAPALAAAA